MLSPLLFSGSVRPSATRFGLSAFQNYWRPHFCLPPPAHNLLFYCPPLPGFPTWRPVPRPLLLALFGNWPSHLFTDAIQNGFHPLLALWLLGSTVMFAGWFIRLGQSRYMLMPAGSEEKEALERARQTFGFTAGIEIGLSRSSNEPSLVGLFRPAITIPQGLRERLSSMEYNAVLLHELAHARRRDKSFERLCARRGLYLLVSSTALVRRKAVDLRTRACL